MQKKFLYFILIFLVGVISAGCEKQKQQEPREEVIPVKVSRVALKDFNETIDYVGNIKAQDEAIIYPKVSGKVIQKCKEDGTRVSKGEIVAYIDRDEVGFKFEKAPVESPLDGTIGRCYVDIGTNVTPQTPIALVVDQEKAEITLDIPENKLPRVSLGQQAEINVDAYPSEVFIGSVTKVSPVVNPETRAAPVEITVDNAGYRLKSGMFARVKLIIKQYKGAVVVLKEAIMGHDPDFYLYVIENNRAVSKKIKLGARQGQHFMVADGLKEGDLTVVMGQQRLYEGAKVIVEEEKSGPAPGTRSEG